MKTVGEIEELMRAMGRRTRRMEAERYALTKEELLKLQSAVHAATSSSAAPPVSKTSNTSGKVSNRGTLATPKPGSKSGFSKQLLEKIVREIRSSHKEPLQYNEIHTIKKLKLDAPKLDKEIHRYLQLKEEVVREVTINLLTDDEAERRISKARDHLKAELILSGVIKISAP